MIRIVYVSLPCTDPDWDGTVTKQTDIHISVLALKGAIIITNLSIY